MLLLFLTIASNEDKNTALLTINSWNLFKKFKRSEPFFAVFNGENFFNLFIPPALIFALRTSELYLKNKRSYSFGNDANILSTSFFTLINY